MGLVKPDFSSAGFVLEEFKFFVCHKCHQSSCQLNAAALAHRLQKYILTVSNNANMLKFLDSIGLHLDCFLSIFLPVDLSAQRQKKVAINISANHMSTCHRYHIDLSTTPVMSPSHYMDLRGMMVDQASDHSLRLRSNFLNKMWSKWVFLKDTSGQFPHMFQASKPGVLNKTLFILRQNIIFSRP